MSMQPAQAAITYCSTARQTIAGGQQFHIEEQENPCFAIISHQRAAITLSSSRTGLHSSGKALSGECFLIPAGSSCMLVNLAKQELPLTLIYFKAADHPGTPYSTSDIPSEEYWYARQEFLSFRMPQLRSWAEDFQAGLQSDGSDPSLFYLQQSHVYAIASGLVQHIGKPAQPESHLLNYVGYVQQFMMEHYSVHVDIEELARSSGTSASRFYQSFRWQTGLSPHKYITKIRLDAALRLLAHTSSSIVGIAHSVGYPDEYYFSRLFKKQMGLSPTEYASCARKRIATMTTVFDGDLAALGITPCLSFQRGWQDNPAPVLRELAASKPELILTGPVSPELHGELSQIAPVVMLHWKKYSWKERLLDIGERLGLTSVAERWLAGYDLKVENARIHVKNHLGNEPVLLVEVGRNCCRVYGMKWKKMKDVFYDDLQVKPPATMEQTSFIEVASVAEIEAMDCDNVMFLLPPSATATTCRELERQWRGAEPRSIRKRCYFIKHDSEQHYNASVHESLVDHTVHHMLAGR
ncbi:helix-turn-helix domain-containing protein [Paenibacillus nasutitermitis]|uniref:HTH araC/xylS-type domain-containing protein n=1 Tax=Paenibacillus nasutitermitis TaxID=1652958 RepID=A0A916ZAB3_9BACL|nr:AraC family transcriptional regulator [Paenibacillus nasutitermitis]GGD83943.1 hypothetical protein GCM10010911_47690 [Paenibacillus nasutitermitis]